MKIRATFQDGDEVFESSDLTNRRVSKDVEAFNALERDDVDVIEVVGGTLLEKEVFRQLHEHFDDVGNILSVLGYASEGDAQAAFVLRVLHEGDYVSDAEELLDACTNSEIDSYHGDLCFGVGDTKSAAIAMALAAAFYDLPGVLRNAIDRTKLDEYPIDYSIQTEDGKWYVVETAWSCCQQPC